jgi:hypothetical protein
MANTFWGVALAGIGTYIAIPLSAAKATVDALNGKSFGESFNETGGKIVDAFSEFGDKHAEKLTDAVISVGNRVAGDIIHDHLRRKDL